MASATSPVFWSNCSPEVTTTPAQQVAAVLARATQRQTDSGGCQLAWQQWSAPAQDKPPLLLLHGGFGSWTHWIANIDGLASARELWTVDLPGLGSSGDMPEPFTTEHFAQLLLAGWRGLIGEDRPFELAGFSFGAMIAGHLAALAGQQCQRCTLIGASGFGALHQQVRLIPPPGPEVAADEAQAIHRENLSRLMLYKPQSVNDLAVHVHADNLARHRFRSRSLAGSNDLADILPAISAHLVGVWGDQDATAGGPANIEERKKLFRAAQADAQFYRLPDVGHWAMYEAPDKLNALLRGQFT
jgi:pimeloyl-ACP methyl ester carboxylesterase